MVVTAAWQGALLKANTLKLSRSRLRVSRPSLARSVRRILSRCSDCRIFCSSLSDWRDRATAPDRSARRRVRRRTFGARVRCSRPGCAVDVRHSLVPAVRVDHQRSLRAAVHVEGRVSRAAAGEAIRNQIVREKCSEEAALRRPLHLHQGLVRLDDIATRPNAKSRR